MRVEDRSQADQKALDFGMASTIKKGDERRYGQFGKKRESSSGLYMCMEEGSMLWLSIASCALL